MTGFGRSQVSAPFGTISIELQSINRKGLEIIVKLPNEFLELEASVRKWISDAIGRGRVHALLTVDYDKGSPIDVHVNRDLVNKLQSACQELGLGQITAKELFAFEQIISFKMNSLDPEIYEPTIKEAVEAALAKLLPMKQAEGDVLERELAGRLNTCRTLMLKIEQKSVDAGTEYRKKLVERLEGIISNISEDQRVLKEIALFAEKVDVSEEITRFFSHLDQFGKSMGSPDGPIGKKLEFICQEMQREIGTILAKTPFYEVSELGIEIKSELEKMREQLQNVE